MNMVDRLLKADVVNKLAERPEKKVKMERLSKLFGFDFIITLRLSTQKLRRYPEDGRGLHQRQRR